MTSFLSPPAKRVFDIASIVLAVLIVVGFIMGLADGLMGIDPVGHHLRP